MKKEEINVRIRELAVEQQEHNVAIEKIKLDRERLLLEYTKTEDKPGVVEST